MIPDISKWKLNDYIKINNIFRGCNSLLSIPDISKWNIDIPEESKISSLNQFIKEIKSDLQKSDDIAKKSNSSNDSSSLKDNNDI